MTLEDLGDLIEDLGDKANFAGNVAKVRSANELAKIRQLLEEQANPSLREARLKREKLDLEKQHLQQVQDLQRKRVEKVVSEVRWKYMEQFGLQAIFSFLCVFLLLLPGLYLAFFWMILIAVLGFASCVYCFLTRKRVADGFGMVINLCLKVPLRALKSRFTSTGLIYFGLGENKLAIRTEEFFENNKIAIDSGGSTYDAIALEIAMYNGELKIGHKFKYSLESILAKDRFITEDLLKRAQRE